MTPEIYNEKIKHATLTQILSLQRSDVRVLEMIARGGDAMLREEEQISGASSNLLTTVQMSGLDEELMRCAAVDRIGDLVNYSKQGKDQDLTFIDECRKFLLTLFSLGKLPEDVAERVYLCLCEFKDSETGARVDQAVWQHYRKYPNVVWLSSLAK